MDLKKTILGLFAAATLSCGSYDGPEIKHYRLDFKNFGGSEYHLKLEKEDQEYFRIDEQGVRHKLHYLEAQGPKEFNISPGDDLILTLEDKFSHRSYTYLTNYELFDVEGKAIETLTLGSKKIRIRSCLSKDEKTSNYYSTIFLFHQLQYDPKTKKIAVDLSTTITEDFELETVWGEEVKIATRDGELKRLEELLVEEE